MTIIEAISEIQIEIQRIKTELNKGNDKLESIARNTNYDEIEQINNGFVIGGMSYIAEDKIIDYIKDRLTWEYNWLENELGMIREDDVVDVALEFDDSYTTQKFNDAGWYHIDQIDDAICNAEDEIIGRIKDEIMTNL